MLGMASEFTNNFTNVVTSGFTDIGKGMKEMFEDILQYILKMLAQLAMNMAIFGSIKGMAGYAGEGLLGLLRIPVPAHGEGGIALQPHLALIGDRPEAIIPLDRGKEYLGGNVSIVVNNNVSRAEASVRESDDGRGGRKIEILLEEIIARGGSRLGSPVNRMVQSMGGRNQLIRR